MTKQKEKKFDIIVTSMMGSNTSIFVHTILFVFFLTLPLMINISYDTVLLILTTIVSLEAIYLALFIQISINRQGAIIDEVSEDIEEIQEDVEEIQEDVEEVSKDVEEMQEDVEEIGKDVDELSDDVEEMQEDFEEAEKEEETEEEKEDQRKMDQKNRLEKIENTLEVLLKEISNLRK